MLYLAYNDIVVMGIALSDAFFLVLLGVALYSLVLSVRFFRGSFLAKILLLYVMFVSYVFAIGVAGTHFCTSSDQSVWECVKDAAISSD